MVMARKLRMGNWRSNGSVTDTYRTSDTHVTHVTHTHVTSDTRTEISTTQTMRHADIYVDSTRCFFTITRHEPLLCGKY